MTKGHSNKTRKRTGKDLDEVADSLAYGKIPKICPIDYDLPGNGQFFCSECARYFVNDDCLAKHRSTKLHKRRLRLLKEVPFSQKEAEASAGLGSYSATKGGV